jgi:two-component system, NtrC family, sensor kinase
VGHPAFATLQEMALTVADARQSVQQITDITRGIELSQRRRDLEDEADLSDVARLTLTSLQGELRQRALLEVAIDALPPVRGARGKLGQVVLNLIVNAMQSLPTRPRTQNRIRISLKREGDRARLDVEDNGSRGLDEDAQRIFDPFFSRIGSAGTGLGLAISRQIVEEVGGTLRVTSTGEGCCFSAAFPFTAQGATSAA